MVDSGAPSGPRIEGPDAEGFHHILFAGSNYNAGYGEILARADGPETARVRIGTTFAHANQIGTLHGGFLLSFLDQALFVGTTTLGRSGIGAAVTLAIATQFVGAGRDGEPVDCLVEIVEETGRLLFLRGQIEQGERRLLTYQATLRKLGAPKG